MKTFGCFENLKILSKRDFCIIGEVTDCLLDKDLKKLAYFLCINGDEKFVLPYSFVRSFSDVIVVDDRTEIRSVVDIDFTQFKSLCKKDVYTDSGECRGVVTDLVFEGDKLKDVCVDDHPLKPNTIEGVGEIVVLKPPVKRRKKQKSTPMTSLTSRPSPVAVLSAPVPAVNLSVPPSNTAPPRVVSDYNFLLGRTLQDDLYTYQGQLIAKANTFVTVEIVEKARLNGKLLELTLNSK